MIIQCQACLARFKLDPSRIKGKGARIRCRKCGEAIIVMKSDFPPPEATPPVKKDLFDLRAVLHEPETTVPVPTHDKVDTPPSREQETDQVTTLQVEGTSIPTEREPEPPWQKVAEPSEEPAATSRDEADASFESPLFREEETEKPPLPEEELAPPTEREPEAPWQKVAEPSEEPAATSRDEADASFESPLVREEKADESPSPTEEEPPPPSAEKEAFDLRSVIYEPEDKTTAPSHDEIEAPFESPPLREEETEKPPLPEEELAPPTESEPEPPWQKVAEPSEEPAATSRDEADASFESPSLSEEKADEGPSPTEEEPPPPSAEKEAFDLRSVIYEPEDKTAAPSHDEIEAPFESPLLSEEKADEGPSPTEEEPPPPSLEEDALYLRSVLYVPEEKTAAPSHDEIEATFESPPLSEEEAEQARPLPTEDPMPSMEGEREVLGQEPAEPSAQPTLSSGNEIDLAAETLFSREGMSDQTPRLPAENPMPTLDPLGDPISPDLGKGKEISFLKEQGIPAQGAQKAADGESLTVPPPSEEKSVPGEEQEDFLPLDTALPDFLRKMESTAEPAKRFDISGRLRTSPPETSEEDTGPVSPVPDHPPEIEEPPFSRADTLQEELAEIADVAPVEEAHVAEPPPPDTPPPMPLEIERKQVTYQRSRVRSGKPSIALLFLLFAVLAGGGAYLAFTKTGQDTLRTIVPSLESYWLGGKETVPPYHVGNLIGYYENGNAGKMFIIKGVVTNQARTAKSGIRIHAELLDVNQQTIAEKTAYAGNIFPGLRSAARERIEAAMSNHLGDKLSNVDVGPGKSVPFMVVFFDSPEGIEEYRLEALDTE
jgi:predicted Zn finger-like uncharacterized protein